MYNFYFTTKYSPLAPGDEAHQDLDELAAEGDGEVAGHLRHGDGAGGADEHHGHLKERGPGEKIFLLCRPNVCIVHQKPSYFLEQGHSQAPIKLRWDWCYEEE